MGLCAFYFLFSNLPAILTASCFQIHYKYFRGKICNSSSVKFCSGTLKFYTGSGTFINKGFLVTENGLKKKKGKNLADLRNTEIFSELLFTGLFILLF